MKSRRVLVLRHGEPADTQLFYGQLDVELSKRGLAQVEAQAARLASTAIARILSSDLKRAVYGAKAIAARRSLEAGTVLEVEVRPELREMHLGILEGVPMQAARERFPSLAGRSYLDMLDFGMPEGGESVRDVATRALPVVEAALEEMDKAEQHGALLIYCHNTVARLLVAQAAGLGVAGYTRFKQSFAGISGLDVQRGLSGAQLWKTSQVVWTNERVVTEFDQGD